MVPDDFPYALLVRVVGGKGRGVRPCIRGRALLRGFLPPAPGAPCLQSALPPLSPQPPLTTTRRAPQVLIVVGLASATAVLKALTRRSGVKQKWQ